VELLKDNGNQPMHYQEIADKTGIIVHNVRRITGQNVEGKVSNPVFERVQPGVYKLLEKTIVTPEKLSLLFTEFSNTYTTEVDTPEREKCLYILKNIEEEVRKIAPSEYVIKGSGGMAFNPTSTPWIGIRDPDYADGFQRGIYIFYSLSEDKKFLYLSIGQGTDNLKKELGSKAAKLQLTSNAASVQHLLKEIISKEKYIKKIDLKSNQDRAKSYEDSVFIGRKYFTNKMPNDDVLINHLKKIIDIYPTIVNLVNNHAKSVKVGTASVENKAAEKIKQNITSEFKNSVEKKYKLTKKSLSGDDVSKVVIRVTEKVNHEDKLDERFINYIDKNTIEAYHSDPVDIVVVTKNENWYIESKILDGVDLQTNAAQAMGQIMYYDFVLDESKKNKLALLFHKKPNKKTGDFLTSNNMPFIWEEEGRFLFSGNIGELPL
tara:strand:- start:204 stop:1502 length:1299 start_codon:yes stop_codon:yes gene_type:complete